MFYLDCHLKDCVYDTLITTQINKLRFSQRFPEVRDGKEGEKHDHSFPDRMRREREKERVRREIDSHASMQFFAPASESSSSSSSPSSSSSHSLSRNEGNSRKAEEKRGEKQL